jgi:hypothetical protein
LLVDSTAAFIILACVQAGFALLLVGVTAFYALRTHAIAQSTAEQAAASLRLAEEAREQRRGAQRPNLLIDVDSPAALVWDMGGGPVDRPVARRYPRSIDIRIHNAGFGPAKELVVTFLHPFMGYEQVRRGFLLRDDLWNVTVSADPLQVALMRQPPIGLGAWLAAQGFDRDPVGDDYDAGLLVGYRDIDGSPWATFLIVGQLVTTNFELNPDDPNHYVRTELYLHGQRRMPLTGAHAL